MMIIESDSVFDPVNDMVNCIQLVGREPVICENQLEPLSQGAQNWLAPTEGGQL